MSKVCVFLGKMSPIALIIVGLLGMPSLALAFSANIPTLPSRNGLDLVKDSEFYMLSQASNAIRKGDYTHAVPILEATTEKNPVNILGLFHLGSTYLELAKSSKNPVQQQAFLNKAKAAFGRVTDLNNDLVLTYFKLGKIALMQGDIEGAKQAYRNGLQVEPTNASLLFNLARVYDQNNERNEAITYYQKTLEADPNFTFAYNNLALLYEEGRNFAEAEKSYKMALKKDQSYNLARLNLGNLYANNGQYEASQKMFTEAQAQEPQNEWVYYYTGNLYLRMSQYDRAITAYHKALELNPGNATAYYLLAVSLSKVKRMDEALQASLHYMQLEPEGLYAKEMQSLILTMKLSQSGGFYFTPSSSSTPTAKRTP